MKEETFGHPTYAKFCKTGQRHKFFVKPVRSKLWQYHNQWCQQQSRIVDESKGSRINRWWKYWDGLEKDLRQKIIQDQVVNKNTKKKRFKADRDAFAAERWSYWAEKNSDMLVRQQQLHERLRRHGVQVVGVNEGEAFDNSHNIIAAVNAKGPSQDGGSKLNAKLLSAWNELVTEKRFDIFKNTWKPPASTHISYPVHKSGNAAAYMIHLNSLIQQMPDAKFVVRPIGDKLWARSLRRKIHANARISVGEATESPGFISRIDKSALLLDTIHEILHEEPDKVLVEKIKTVDGDWIVRKTQYAADTLSEFASVEEQIIYELNMYVHLQKHECERSLRCIGYMRSSENSTVNSLIFPYRGRNLDCVAWGTVDHKEVIFWMREMLLALEELHAASVIHRNIKPENIVFDKNGLTLIDFESARLRYDVKHNYTAFDYRGNPRYGAPEPHEDYLHCRGRSPYGKTVYGRRRDIFSLGIIFGEILWSRHLGDCGFEDEYMKMFSGGKTSRDRLQERERLCAKLQEGCPCAALAAHFKAKILVDVPNFPKDDLFYTKGCDLVRQMMNFDRIKRIMASQALEHDFFELELEESDEAHSEDQASVEAPDSEKQASVEQVSIEVEVKDNIKPALHVDWLRQNLTRPVLNGLV